jgi:hypothetical protein
MLLRFAETVNRLGAYRADTALRVFLMKIRQRISLRNLKNPIEPQIVANCLYSHMQCRGVGALTFSAMMLSTRAAYLGYSG